MAVSIVKLFDPVQLGTSNAVIYTMPSTTGAVLKNGAVRLTNTSGGAVTVTLYADVATDVSGASNCFLSAASIAANSSLVVQLPTLATGDTLRGAASAATSITVHEAGGVIYTP